MEIMAPKTHEPEKNASKSTMAAIKRGARDRRGKRLRRPCSVAGKNEVMAASIQLSYNKSSKRAREQRKADGKKPPAFLFAIRKHSLQPKTDTG